MVNLEEKQPIITFTDTSKLAEDVSTLYLNQKFSDVVVVIDGKKIHAHKAILSVRSEYFKSRLSLESREANQNVITIAEPSQEAFLKLVKYIYTGNITIASDEELLVVLALAHRYAFKDLALGLIAQSKSIITEENVASILNAADQYECEELQLICHAFMDAKAPEILSNDRLSDLTQKSMIKLLKRDTFNAPEIDIFQSVAKWCEKNPHDEEFVLQCVRISLLSVEEIVSIVSPTKLVNSETLLEAITKIVLKSKASQDKSERKNILSYEGAFKDLDSGSETPPKSVLTLKTVSSMLNTANLYELEGLREVCHGFIDAHAPEMLSCDCVNDLTQKSLINLLKRDSFVASEVDIFRSVAQWCDSHDYDDDVVTQCVRLPLLSAEELLSVVWPSQLVRFEDIAEIVDVKQNIATPRTSIFLDENVATLKREAEVISGSKTSELLSGKGDLSKHAEAPIDGESGFIIKLSAATFLNHIKMRLWDQDSRYYSYYIELSVDQVSWHRIIDFSDFACRSVQHLYFEQHRAQYIKIVGTHNTANANFHLIYVKAYFNRTVPKFINGIIYPDENVATPEKKATVRKGHNRQLMLNGEANILGGSTSHLIGTEEIIVQLAQPYMLSSMRLLLWDGDDRSYKYFIETSVNYQDWEMAVDRRNEVCKSWQTLHFKERVVVFVKITGTYNSADDSFHCAYFECPAQDDS